MIGLSCSSACLGGRPLEDALAVHARIGFRRVEVIALGGASGVDLADWDADRLGDVLSRHGQELAALYVRPVDVRSDAGFARSLDYVRRGIETAAALGCTRIVFPPLRPREGYDYARLAEGCRILADQVGGRDVALALENHHEWPLSCPEDYARLFGLLDDAARGHRHGHRPLHLVGGGHGGVRGPVRRPDHARAPEGPRRQAAGPVRPGRDAQRRRA